MTQSEPHCLSLTLLSNKTDVVIVYQAHPVVDDVNYKRAVSQEGLGVQTAEERVRCSKMLVLLPCSAASGRPLFIGWILREAKTPVFYRPPTSLYHAN